MVYNKNLVVAVKVDRRILREQNSKVYLPFGSEYSLFIKNLNSKTALVSINVDGEDILGGYKLIIEPKTSKEVERFIVKGNLSKGPKLKFIEKTKQISDYRGNKIEDGIVRIEYQFEAITPCVVIDKPIHWPTYPPVWPPSPWDRGILYKGTGHFEYNNLHNTSMGGGKGLSSTSTSFESGASCNNNSYAFECAEAASYDSYNDNVNGITVFGRESNQSFNKVSFNNPLEPEVNVICIQLFGENKETGIKVSKPLSVKSKIKCKTCGTTNKSGFRFCRKCGTNLSW